MREALQMCGVFVLSPTRQQETAEALEAEGVGPKEILQIASFIRQSEADPVKQRKFTASLLADAKNARESSTNLKDYLVKHPEQLQEDGDFGAYQRKKDKERQVQHDLDYFEWVAKMKESGNWPPKRDPHPWENGVVKPPKQEAPIARKPHNPNQDRIDDCRHLAGCAKLFVDNKRPIHGHVRTSLKKLGAYWSAAGAPPEVRAALG